MKLNITSTTTEGKKPVTTYETTFTSKGLDVIQTSATKAVTVEVRIPGETAWVKSGSLKTKDTINQLELVSGLEVRLSSLGEFTAATLD